MSAFKHILVPTDFSECANQAIIHAFNIAGLSAARVTLLHIVTIFDDDPYNPEQKFPDLDKYYAMLETSAGGAIRDTVRHRRVSEVEVEQIVRRGFSASEVILDIAAENPVDLIVMGTHGRKPLAHLLLGSVAESVVRHARCPVLTCRVMPTEYEIAGGYRRILIPTDFSESSRRALEAAARLLPETGGQLDVLHVVEDNIHPAYYVGGKTSIFDLLPDIRERSLQALREFVDFPGLKDVRTESMIREGKTVNQIIEHCNRQRIDLIALGSRGLSDLEYLLIGSVTERVVRKSTCPVLTVK